MLTSVKATASPSPLRVRCGCIEQREQVPLQLEYMKKLAVLHVSRTDRQIIALQTLISKLSFPADNMDNLLAERQGSLTLLQRCCTKTTDTCQLVIRQTDQHELWNREWLHYSKQQQGNDWCILITHHQGRCEGVSLRPVLSQWNKCKCHRIYYVTIENLGYFVSNQSVSTCEYIKFLDAMLTQTPLNDMNFNHRRLRIKVTFSFSAPSARNLVIFNLWRHPHCIQCKIN